MYRNLKNIVIVELCEVPDDSYSTKLFESEEKKNLHIQIDQIFINEVERLKMSDLKGLTDILENILDTDLRILKIKDGSIILIFHCLHELDVLFPLCSKQEEELQEIGFTVKNKNIFSNPQHV